MEKIKKNTRRWLVISWIALVAMFLLALMIGKFKISFGDFFKIIFDYDDSLMTQRSIIVNLRLPRTIIAMLSGIALSLSGLLYQEVFQNKLVSPDLLGVSSGAGFGASIAIVLELSSLAISLSAFIAGICTVLMTITISKIFRNNSPMTLPLAGIIVGGFMQALLSFVKYMADPNTVLSEITYWLMGSFANSSYADTYILLPIVILISIFLLLYSRVINELALGKEEAITKGNNYQLNQLIVIVVATLLTATSVAFSGSISWIGLSMPHLVRLITGRNANRSIPLSIPFGGTFMIVADVLSRTFTADEIPLTAITGFFGTIVFVVLLAIDNNKGKEND